MSAKDAVLAEWDREMAGTRKTLALIPDAHLDWAPHAKSMKLGKLGNHIATMGMWAESACSVDVYDFATAPRPSQATATSEILALHDEWSAKGRAAIVALPESQFGDKWTLKNGAHTILTSPRATVLRGFVMNHMIHHRAQLTVYLRLLDIPVPGLYGPSADEM